jgi:hypothetical protein
MSGLPLLRQPVATAVAAALLGLGVTGTAWATSADSHHPRPPAQTTPRTR